jgi:hypothetical protein
MICRLRESDNASLIPLSSQCEETDHLQTEYMIRNIFEEFRRIWKHLTIRNNFFVFVQP